MPKAIPQADIDAEIAALEAQIPRVRPESAFGDKHPDAIRAQIAVLREQLDEEEIDDRAEDEEWEDNVKDAALEAYKFWNGEPLDDTDTLSEAWEALCS